MQRPDQSASNLVSRFSCDSQDPQWKKLELKYKECIRLLKKKIVQLESKQNTVTKASLSVSGCEPLGARMGRVVERRVRWGWERVRGFAEWGCGRERKGMKVQNVVSGMRVLERVMGKRKMKCLQDVVTSQYNIQQTIKHFANILQCRLTSLKTYAFLSLKLSTKPTKISQLLFLKQLLSSPPPTSPASPTPLLYQLTKQNHLLKSTHTTLQLTHSTQTQHLSTRLSLLQSQLKKKQHTITQLIQQLSEKQKIIGQYELEIETYRGLKGKLKCSHDCVIEKRKLGKYYENALAETRVKKEIIGEWERRYGVVERELEKARRKGEVEVGELRRMVEELEREGVELRYERDVAMGRVENANRRMRIVDDNESVVVELEKQVFMMKGAFMDIIKLLEAPENTQQTLTESITKIAFQMLKDSPPVSHPPTPTPSHLLTLIQKMLSQPDLQLTDYPLLPKLDQQRLQLIQTTISQMKAHLSKPQAHYNPQQPQTDPLLILKPAPQRITTTDLLPRIIDLETQARRNEQLILSTKKKFLEAREVVLMCLDLLAVRNIGTEAMKKLEELFDLFEYTEEQREGVLMASMGSKGRFFNRWF